MNKIIVSQKCIILIFISYESEFLTKHFTFFEAIWIVIFQFFNKCALFAFKSVNYSAKHVITVLTLYVLLAKAFFKHFHHVEFPQITQTFP